MTRHYISVILYSKLTFYNGSAKIAKNRNNGADRKENSKAEPMYGISCNHSKNKRKQAAKQSIAQNAGLEDPATRLVFLTEIHDTRFDAFGVLRPLDAAH